MLHLPLLINTLPGDRVVGEECLAVAALQIPRESSPTQPPPSEDVARDAGLQLNSGSHKRSNKYWSNKLCRQRFLGRKTFLNGLHSPAIASTLAGSAGSWHPLPPKGIP